MARWIIPSRPPEPERSWPADCEVPARRTPRHTRRRGRTQHARRRRRRASRAHGVGDPTAAARAKVVRRAAGEREHGENDSRYPPRSFAGLNPRRESSESSSVPRASESSSSSSVPATPSMPVSLAAARTAARDARSPATNSPAVVVVVVAPAPASPVDVSHRPGLDPRRSNKLRHERVHDLALRRVRVTRDVLEQTQPSKRRRGDQSAKVLARLERAAEIARSYQNVEILAALAHRRERSNASANAARFARLSGGCDRFARARGVRTRPEGRVRRLSRRLATNGRARAIERTPRRTTRPRTDRRHERRLDRIQVRAQARLGGEPEQRLGHAGARGTAGDSPDCRRRRRRGHNARRNTADPRG